MDVKPVPAVIRAAPARAASNICLTSSAQIRHEQAIDVGFILMSEEDRVWGCPRKTTHDSQVTRRFSRSINEVVIRRGLGRGSALSYRMRLCARSPLCSQSSAISICALRASAYAHLSKMKVRRLTTHVSSRRRFVSIAALSLVIVSSGCKKQSAISAEKAKGDVVALALAAHSDVAEVRAGLPQGAKFLLPIFTTGKPASDDPHAARLALETARNKVQDLRVSKGTFFAVAGTDGVVIRNDQDQDAMAGHALLPAFPELKAALAGQYVETRGSLPEAAGVRGRADGQWVAAQPVLAGTEVKGLYVTGWSWAAYARRLEFALGSKLRSTLAEGQKMPLVYVYLVVGKEVFGAPISPEVNARAIAQLSPLTNASANTPTSFELEIDGREFGLAVELTPDLGKDVAVAVLRSET